MISRNSRVKYSFGRNRILPFIQNKQELSFLGWDLVNGLWMAFCTFFSNITSQQQCLSHSCLVLHILGVSLGLFLQPVFCPGSASFFPDTSYLSAFIKRVFYKNTDGKGNTHLACAVKWPCGTVLSSQVGRAVPPTCAALAAGCSTGCPERRLANKQLGKSLQLLVPLPSLRTAIKCFCSGSADLKSFFQAAPFLSSFGTISHTIIFLSHLQEEQSAWTCSQYHSPPQNQERWAESHIS